MSNDKKKISQEEAKQDYVTNKLLSVFTVAFVMIIGIMYFSRKMQRADTFVPAMKDAKTLSIVLLVLTVLFAVLAIIFKIKGKEEKYKLITPKHLAVVFAFATVCFGALSADFDPYTVNFLYVIIAAATVLFIVYHTYPCDFFAISAVSAFGAIGIWLTSSAIRGGMGATKLWLIIGTVLSVCAILVVLTIVMQANGGSLRRGSEKKFFDDDAKYYLIYGAIALVLALLAATWLMVGAATYYFLSVILAYFVVAGIYYTLKMI